MWWRIFSFCDSIVKISHHLLSESNINPFLLHIFTYGTAINHRSSSTYLFDASYYHLWMQQREWMNRYKEERQRMWRKQKETHHLASIINSSSKSSSNKSQHHRSKNPSSSYPYPSSLCRRRRALPVSVVVCCNNVIEFLRFSFPLLGLLPLLLLRLCCLRRLLSHFLSWITTNKKDQILDACCVTAFQWRNGLT